MRSYTLSITGEQTAMVHADPNTAVEIEVLKGGVFVLVASSMAEIDYDAHLLCNLEHCPELIEKTVVRARGFVLISGNDIDEPANVKIMTEEYAKEDRY